MLSLELAWRFVLARKRPMLFSLAGIVFGVAFFVITQAQTSGFEKFFVQTILGTNGSIRISDDFQDTFGTVEQVDQDGMTKFHFHSREDAIYRKGVSQPELIRRALNDFPEILGISEIIEGSGTLATGSRSHGVKLNGVNVADHLQTSDLSNQLIHGSIEEFSSDQMSVLLGSRIFKRLNVNVGERIRLDGGTGTLHLRLAGVFETGVSQIDKNLIFIHLGTAQSFLGREHGGSVFQLSITDPERAPQLAQQIQSTLNHRAVSWQEREKTRDIAILRSIGFSSSDVSALFLWQGAIVLLAGIFLGSFSAFLGTWLISLIPLRIRGIFSTDSFVVNWDWSHYITASVIAVFFVSIATWIPARRASKIEPAKVIRETL
jgi:lipoprotein-releasing system permease protein